MGCIEEGILQEIRQERAVRDASPCDDLMDLIRGDEVDRAVENLVFYSDPECFRSTVHELLENLSAVVAADESCLRNVLSFTVQLCLAMRSFLPNWNLTSQDRHGEGALSPEEVRAMADSVHGAACGLAQSVPEVAEELLREWRLYHTARFEAENVEDNAASAAQLLVGGSIGSYLDNLSAEIEGSNLRRIAEFRLAGNCHTEISNDYGAFLQYALYVGASFATTNPPLVDMAWLADEMFWNDVVDEVITANPGVGVEQLARLITLEVVLSSMRLLRPIFLLTEGAMGCVCLQVNPHLHGDGRQMADAAVFFYDVLRERLGGVPNVVFKLPGTLGGLEACRELTRRGIGVTITVSFGMFQHVPFLRAMLEGNALFCCLVEMNGRLAYPVRDELLGKLSDLEAVGIDEAVAREAAAWSGIAVVKKLHSLLCDKGYDPRRYKPLIASLRWYTGDGYDRLPSACPDITEVLGTSLISVFPNIRRPFDELSGLVLDPDRVSAPVPEHIMDVLAHSEVFKQAYYNGDPEWATGDEDRFKPDEVLELADERAVMEWPPVQQTMAQFEEAYDVFVRRIVDRTALGSAKE